MRERRAGILLPLFSLRGRRDWGVGDLSDLPGFCRWLASAGHTVLQLLPLAEMAIHETSPYGALTAFGLDPLYLDLDVVEDFDALGGIASLSSATRADLDAARSAPTVSYAGVRRAKAEALAAAFARFETVEAASGSSRAAALDRFIDAESWWLAAYVSFRALLDAHGHQAWSTWEPASHTAGPAGFRELAPPLARAARYHAWVQWLLAEQWAAARREAAALGVRLYGDVPFMVSAQSADVWARQDEFRLDATIGAPPDAFSDDGQDWGLPVMRWDVMAANDYVWWRARCRRAAALFDGVRLDHVVGYYRVFERPADGPPSFRPGDEAAQLALGERLLGVAAESGSGLDLIGEDLGAVPDWVRASLSRLGVPGFRVLRWEEDQGRFRDPRDYPELSVATTGTHDTSSLATWWQDEIGATERAALAALPDFAGLDAGDDGFAPPTHAALLNGLYRAGSNLVILPFMDAYGGRERINVPATVQDANWTYRVPWMVDELFGEAGAQIAARLRELGRVSNRLP